MFRFPDCLRSTTAIDANPRRRPMKPHGSHRRRRRWGWVPHASVGGGLIDWSSSASSGASFRLTNFVDEPVTNSRQIHARSSTDVRVADGVLAAPQPKGDGWHESPRPRRQQQPCCRRAVDLSGSRHGLGAETNPLGGQVSSNRWCSSHRSTLTILRCSGPVCHSLKTTSTSHRRLSANGCRPAQTPNDVVRLAALSGSGLRQASAGAARRQYTDADVEQAFASGLPAHAPVATGGHFITPADIAGLELTRRASGRERMYHKLGLDDAAPGTTRSGAHCRVANT